MLAQLALLATAIAGLAGAPWWFWLVAATALAVLNLTEPDRLHPRYADGGIAEQLLFSSLASFSTGCIASAAAFAAGRFAAPLLFP